MLELRSLADFGTHFEKKIKIDAYPENTGKSQASHDKSLNLLIVKE